MATVFELIVSEEFDSEESTCRPVSPTPSIRIVPTPEDERAGNLPVAVQLSSLLSSISKGQQHHASSRLFEDCTQLLHIVATSEPERETVLALRGQAARRVLDALQAWLDRASPHDICRRVAIYLLVKLSAASNDLPASLFITGVDAGTTRDATRVGGFADVFRATYNGVGVAVKRLRIMEGDKADMHPRFCREALIWRQLRHPHVLPFIGVDAETFRSTNFLCMVSPWMEQGTIMDYLKSAAYRPEIDCNRLLREAGEGLFYLHSQKVVHGDINGANIFVDSEHHARLADFGLISLGDKTAGRMSTTMGTLGTVRWMAPERLHADAHARRTQAADVYAFGCLCLTMYTHKQPYCHLSDFAVIVAVALKGELPARPTDEQCQGVQMADELWELLLRCWDREPGRRPSMGEVLRYFGVVEEPVVKSPTPEKTSFLDEEPVEEPQMAPLYVRRDALPKGLWRQRQQRRAMKQKKKEKEERVPGWSRPARVLIVDDDAVMRMLVSKFLQIFGCTCDVATNGADAVEKMNSGHQYDLVLMDIMMPKLDGVSATSMIRQFDSRTPIISMTTASSPADVQIYKDHGMNDVLPKPFNKDGLFGMLEKHLASIDVNKGKPTKENNSRGRLAVPSTSVVVGASSSSRRSPSPSSKPRRRSPLKVVIPESSESSPATVEESPIQVLRPQRHSPDISQRRSPDISPRRSPAISQRHSPDISQRRSPDVPRLGTYTPPSRGARPRREDGDHHRYQPYPRQLAFGELGVPVAGRE